MTPDCDLGTVEGIVRTVEAMMEASQTAMEAALWAKGVPGLGPDAQAGVAYQCATEAAHHARRLQGVAELVSVSGDLAAWQEWRERGKA